MSSVFSKIVAGEIPCYKVAEDSDHLAFLDVFPLVKGHVLVIPKKETDYLFDLSEKEYSRLWEFARVVALKLKTAIPCNRVAVSVIGLEVPHAHIHLIPMNTMNDVNFANEKLKLSKEEFLAIADAIRKE